MFWGRILLTVSIALSAPLTTGAIDRTANFDQRLLAAHNRERALVGVPALAWDENLAADAKGWAEALAATNSFEHSRADPSDPETPGENLWAGTKGAFAPEDMVGYWIAEKHDYKPGLIPAVSRSGNFEKVGHYTQVVWRDTRKVGCAVARSAREDILVCRYTQGGNVIGERAL